MNNLKVKSISIIFLFIIIFSSLFSSVVNAVQIESQAGTWYHGYTYWTPPYQNQLVHGGTGKYVIAYWSAGSTPQYIIIKVFNVNTGANTATIQVDTITGANNKLSLLLGSFDEDEIFVAWGSYVGDKIKICKVNIVTNSVGTIYSLESGVVYFHIGNYVIYNSNIYFVVSTCYSASDGTANDYLGIYKFTGSALSKLVQLTHNSGHLLWQQVPWMMKDLESENKVYIIYGDGADASTSSTPRYYVADLDTASLEQIAQAGTNNLLPNEQDNIWKVQHFGGGNYELDGYNYLYFAYGYPYVSGSNRYYSMSVSILKFNGTISDDYLVSQTVRTYVKHDSSATISNEGHLFGYMDGENTLICWYGIADIPNNNQERATLVMTDPIDTAETTFDSTLFSGEYYTILVHDIDNVVGKDATQENHFLVASSGATCYIVIGGEILEYNYSITISIVPNDSPLIAGVSYNYVVTVYLNDVISSGEIVEIVIEGLIIKIANTNSYGQVSIPNLIFSTAGNKDIVDTILDNEGETLYSVENTYVVASEEPETPEEAGNILIPQAFSIILTYVPAMIIVFFPMITGYEYMGFAGFIVGAIMGIGLGAWSGFVPMYMVYLLLLGLVIVLIMKLKGGSDSG